MKQKYHIDEAEPLALQLMADLAPFCQRIVIAGSIRRRKDYVSDIELLFIPRFEERQVDMFSTEPMDLAHEELNRWLATGMASKRPSETGVFAWGAKNKLALHHTGIPVDFFSTTPENFWVSLVIRTGPKEFNLALTTGAQDRGCRLNAYGSGVTILSTGEKIDATSEEHVCELCGVPYAEPEDRR